MISSSAQFYRDNPFYGYSPTRGMLAFHESTHPRRFVRAPNQVSKTYAGAWEAWAHLIGDGRFHQRKAGSGLIMLASLERQYKVVSECLYKTRPGRMIDPASTYIQGVGWRTNGQHMIRALNGHTMQFLPGEGPPISAESATADWGWQDEPPKESHNTGFMMRFVQRGGPVWRTLTPIARPVDYLRIEVEGNPDTGEPPREEWETHRPQLTVEDCLTLDGRAVRPQATIERQIAACPPWEAGQRLRGEWEGLTTGRRLGGFTEHSVLLPEELPQEFDACRVGFDHGEGEGAQYACAWLHCAGKWYLCVEVVMPAHSTPRETARAVIAAWKRFGVAPHFVAAKTKPESGAWGDINTSGLLGGGIKFNEFLERAFAAEMGLSNPPFEIHTPMKGKGSVGTGESALNVGFKEGRLFVASTATKFIGSARNYTGREQDLKHPIDASRYALGEILLYSPVDTRKVVLTF